MTLATDSSFQARVASGAYIVMAFAQLELRSGTARYTTWPVTLDALGQSWMGLGQMGSVGQMHESEDGAEEKLELTFSAADIGTRALALGNPSDYQDQPVTVWLGVGDPATMQLDGAPVKRFAGVMDQLHIEREGTSASISMQCRTASYDVRSNPSSLRMNHAQHVARHPGEMGFAYLQGLIGNPTAWISKWLQANLNFAAQRYGALKK